MTKKQIMDWLKSKKGNMDNMRAIVLGVVVLIIVLALGFKAAEVIQGTQTTNGAGYNATETMIGSDGLGLIVSLLPLAIIILVFAGLFVFFKFLR